MRIINLSKHNISNPRDVCVCPRGGGGGGGVGIDFGIHVHPKVQSSTIFIYSVYGQQEKGTQSYMSALGIIEPAHEIMSLFVLRKLILQTRMRSHPVGLDV